MFRLIRFLVFVLLGIVVVARVASEGATTVDWGWVLVGLLIAAVAGFLDMQINNWWSVVREPQTVRVVAEEGGKVSLVSQQRVPVRIFLSYAREDERIVSAIYERLSTDGYEPWMDVKNLVPGEDWKLAISNAIKQCDFFLACMSPNSVDKRGFLQQESQLALDIQMVKLDSDIFTIPVKLADCEVPDNLSKYQWVDLFKPDGWGKLLNAFDEGLTRRQTNSPN